MTAMNAVAISRYPVPALAKLPADIRERMLEVQEKAGFMSSGPFRQLDEASFGSVDLVEPLTSRFSAARSRTRSG
jgi:hypothetical protein